jgi:DNA-binding CsgD family transcriptional regulator
MTSSFLSFIDLVNLAKNEPWIIAVFFIYSIIAIACMALVCFFVVRKLSPHKIYIRVEHREIEKLRLEYDRLKVTEEKMRAELSFKTRHIIMSMLFLILKNETINAIQKELSKVEGVDDENILTNVSKIATKIAAGTGLEKNWGLFNSNFHKSNLDFLGILSATYTNLTPGDLKLCSLLKSKKDPKEIADLMEISRDSAKIAKHRLKRKLGLNTSDDLDKFLEAFDTNVQHTEPLKLNTPSIILEE